MGVKRTELSPTQKLAAQKKKLTFPFTGQTAFVLSDFDGRRGAGLERLRTSIRLVQSNQRTVEILKDIQ